jgi:hypothetical protein
MTELPLRPGETTDCPFIFCQARVTIVREQRHPGPSAGEVRRIKPHVITNITFYWLDGEPCPASLMVMPLNDAALAALAEYEAMFNRAIERRAADEQAQNERLGRTAPGRQVPDIVRGGYRPNDGRHGREPRPDGRGWRGSTGRG